MNHWYQGRLAALDFESTGKDPEEARIVSAALICCGGGQPTVTKTWLVNPGVPVPAEATAVHHITTEKVQADGQPAAAALDEIAAAVAQALTAGHPIVGHNVGGYDLTLLDRELRRHSLPTVEARAGATGPVLDTLVVDKHVLPYRKRVSKDQGARQLKTLAQVYGVAWSDDDAHGATYDALVSARIAYKVGQIAHTTIDRRPDWVAGERAQRFDDVAFATFLDLHDRQITWAAEQAASFQAFLRKTTPDAVIRGDWPMRPFIEQPALPEAS